jgi:hypothetical protein
VPRHGGASWLADHQTFDHLRKKPIEQRVTVYLDDEPIEALSEAREELAAAQAIADAMYDRRLALARAANPPASELMTIEGGLDAERAASTADARAAVDAAEQAVRESAQLFVFRSPGRKAFEDLIAEHPPTDDDHDDARKTTGRPEALARWHSDTFTPALLAATCVDPKLTVDEAQAIYDEWTDAEVGSSSRRR